MYLVIYIFLWSLIYSELSLYYTTNLINSKENQSILTFNTVSLIHALFCIFMFGSQILFIDTSKWDNQFTTFQTHIAYVSMSYFIYDMIFNKLSSVFILHHLASILTYHITIKYNCFSSLVCYIGFLGELSNPFQILWYVSSKTHNKELENKMFPIFSFMFIFIRGIVIPLLLIDFYWFLLYDSIIPIQPKLIVFLCSLLGSIGSLYWIKKIIYK